MNSFKPDESVRSFCFSCSRDTLAAEEASMCTRCKPNEVLMSDGNCSPCPAGTNFDRRSLTCKPCGYGKFSTGTGVHGTCERCPQFQYSNEMSTECVTCPQGQALISKGNKLTKCGSCPPGAMYEKYKARCKRCSYGVSPGGRIEYCNKCEDGKSPNEERSECL